MTTPQLITMKEIAKEIGVPESSIRKYREIFNDFIPGVGEGRSRRYRSDAVDVFRDIRALREDMHLPWEAVRAKLAEKYAINADSMKVEDEEKPGAVQQPIAFQPEAEAARPAAGKAVPMAAETPAEVEAGLRRMAALSRKQTMMVNAMALEMLRAVEQFQDDSRREREDLIHRVARQTTAFTQMLETMTKEDRALLRDAKDRIDTIEKSLGDLQTLMKKSMRLGEVKEKMIQFKQSLEQKDRAIAELRSSMETLKRENAELKLFVRQPAMPETTHAGPSSVSAARVPDAPKKSGFFQKLIGRKED